MKAGVQTEDFASGPEQAWSNYEYLPGTNQLVGIDGSNRTDGLLYPDGTNTKVGTPTSPNYVYDFNGNMIYDASKKMRVAYDWRNLPVQYSFLSFDSPVDITNQEQVSALAGTSGVTDLVDVNMTYDASGDRVKKETVDHTILNDGGGGTGLQLQIGTETGIPAIIKSNGDLSTTPVSLGTPIDGALEIDYLPDENTVVKYAVMTSSGGIQLYGTFTHNGDLSTEPSSALSFDISSPGAEQTLPASCIDASGNMITAGQSLTGLFTSGVAYLNGSYVSTTGSYTEPYRISYAKIGGEGREEFSSSGGTAGSKVFNFYITDHLGSTRAVWSPDQNANIEALGYLPYGTELPFGVQTAGEHTREKFTGKELDRDGKMTTGTASATGIGLNYFGARAYDPMTGEWTAVDPIASKYPGLSPLNFCFNNPVNNIDNDGKAPDPVTVVAAAGVGYYNMYRAEEASFNRGDPYWTTVGKGLFAFGSSFTAGLVTIPGLGTPGSVLNTVGSSMLTGAASSGANEAFNERVNGQKIDPINVADQAGKGGTVGGLSAFAGMAAWGVGFTSDATTVVQSVVGSALDAATANTSSNDKK